MMMFYRKGFEKAICFRNETPRLEYYVYNTDTVPYDLDTASVQNLRCT